MEWVNPSSYWKRFAMNFVFCCAAGVVVVLFVWLIGRADVVISLMVVLAASVIFSLFRAAKSVPGKPFIDMSDGW